MRFGTASPGAPARRMLTIIVLALAVMLLGQMITLPYVVFRPGPVVDILGTTESRTPMIAVSDAQTYPTKGGLYVTTVSQYGGPGRSLSAWDYLAARLDRDAEVVPQGQVFPEGVTQEQMREQNSAAMTGSQDDAVAVALRALDRPVSEAVTVEAVDPSSPAAGRMKDGDIVAAVNGEPVRTRAQVTQLVQAAPAGPVSVSVRRAGRPHTVQVTPRVVEGRRLMGVVVTSRYDFDLDVAIEAGHIGGPSAGLMFALGIYDRLTPGPLTGGERIAGTGAIAPDGDVIPIGGIVHKMQGAAQEANATWFLSPAQNCSEALTDVPEGMTVLAVHDFAQSRTAVEAIAQGRGESLPRCA